MNRRTALKILGADALGTPLALSQSARKKKKVVVAGAGIGGLCCAYELVKRGFEVVVLEAAGRSGGHILTLHDRLADGLYADAGAEHFYRPGYDHLWRYIEEFQLPVIAYPRRRNLLRSVQGHLYSQDQLSTGAMLSRLGYNQREIHYIHKNSLDDLPGLYYSEYEDKFADEYRPFDAHLNHLDTITGRQFLLEKGASPVAAAWLGGEQSALQAVWHAAIRRKRNMAWVQKNLFRIRGGNQRLTDAFASVLRERLRLGCPVTAIEHSANGVRISYRDGSHPKVEEADHLVTAMSLAMLRQIPVKPQWSPAKRYVVENMPHSSHCRIIFQTRTRFWKTDGVSPNMYLSEPSLNSVWPMADEVQTPRGILIGTAGVATPEKAVAAYRRQYPGKSEDIEESFVVNWTTDPWSAVCLPAPLPPGVLSKYWPEMIEPVGRVHFAGVYADNYPFGMEAAVRSAQRATHEIETS
ncbi:MAG TPA: FAD-dependent oxidoreductase [Tepidisphaeraceae bacterium]|nr:FAD-dependent oxidoreductase [Tepidisphaeraceae bacterium]